MKCMDELNTTTEEMDGMNAAAEASTDTKEVTPGTEQNDQTPPAPEKKYTDADVDRIIAKKIAQERNRMQKLFTEDQQESELDRREREVLKRELQADARDALEKANLPLSLSRMLDYSSREAFDESYITLTDAFKEATGGYIRNFFKGEAPKTGIGDKNIAHERALFLYGKK